MKSRMFLFAILVMMAACTPATQDVTLPPDTAVTPPPEETMQADRPMENPFSPRPDDSNLSRGNVFIQEVDLMIRESFPPQISLHLKGELPTPCNELRVEVGDPTSGNEINIDVYSVVNPDRICTQVLAPFEANIGLGTFPSGHYSIYVNGEPSGEFDS